MCAKHAMRGPFVACDQLNMCLWCAVSGRIGCGEAQMRPSPVVSWSLPFTLIMSVCLFASRLSLRLRSLLSHTNTHCFPLVLGVVCHMASRRSSLVSWCPCVVVSRFRFHTYFSCHPVANTPGI